ncbi:tetratricopeptide repeat protein [Streptomyces sp. 1222.5]|uniref:tetratricopeptide repeat protein n=1 Tax=Streptomyces sp. 1222.5 TaxID=1881026 RepID=UPI003D752A41
MHGLLQALLQRAYDLQSAERDEEALVAYRETLDRLEEAGDRVEPHIAAFTRGSGLVGLGRIHARLGRWEEAVRHLRTSVELCRAQGNTALESRYLTVLGETLLAAGRPEEAREAFDRCVSLGPGADPSRVARVRAHLDRMDADR